MVSTSDLHTFLCILAFSQSTSGFIIKKIECPVNRALCKDPVCHLNFTVDEPKVYHLTFGCTLKTAIPKMAAEIRSYFMMGKTWTLLRGGVTSINICDVSSIVSNPVLRLFAPQYMKQIQTLFHDCPYKDEFMLNDLVIDGDKIPQIGGPMDIKSELAFMKGKYQAFFTLIIFGANE